MISVGRLLKEKLLYSTCSSYWLPMIEFTVPQSWTMWRMAVRQMVLRWLFSQTIFKKVVTGHSESTTWDLQGAMETGTMLFNIDALSFQSLLTTSRSNIHKLLWWPKVFLSFSCTWQTFFNILDFSQSSCSDPNYRQSWGKGQFWGLRRVDAVLVLFCYNVDLEEFATISIAAAFNNAGYLRLAWCGSG